MSDDLDPKKVLSALGNELRWEMVKLLASGSALHAAAVARHFHRDFDGISKHLRILRSAGVLRSRRSDDRRVEQYFLPNDYRQIPGQIDLGFCLLRVPSAQPDASSESPQKTTPSPKAPSPADDYDDEKESDDEEEPMTGFGEMLVRTAAREANPFGGAVPRRRD